MSIFIKISFFGKKKMLMFFQWKRKFPTFPVCATPQFWYAPINPQFKMEKKYVKYVRAKWERERVGKKQINIHERTYNVPSMNVMLFIHPFVLHMSKSRLFIHARRVSFTIYIHYCCVCVFFFIQHSFAFSFLFPHLVCVISFRKQKHH